MESEEGFEKENVVVVVELENEAGESFGGTGVGGDCDMEKLHG